MRRKTHQWRKLLLAVVLFLFLFLFLVVVVVMLFLLVDERGEEEERVLSCF